MEFLQNLEFIATVFFKIQLIFTMKAGESVFYKPLSKLFHLLHISVGLLLALVINVCLINALLYYICIFLRLRALPVPATAVYVVFVDLLFPLCQ